jgi:hypothetical protein
MTTNIFTQNPEMVVHIQKLGLEETPVIVVDDFATSTDTIKELAYSHSEFTLDRQTLYPGIRSPLPSAYIRHVLQIVSQHMYCIYGIELSKTPMPLKSFYSLLSTSPRDLNLLQRLPHFDTNNSYSFAVLHYLAEGQHGGTALYRHKPTQYERITEQRADTYISSAKQFVETNGAPDQAYITDSTNHYEKYYEVEYKPNRLVIYPSNLLHSVTVNKYNDLSDDPKTGRLTANIFIEFK